MLEANDIYVVIYENESSNPEHAPRFLELGTAASVGCGSHRTREEVDFVSRYFKPSYGVPEDPVTGSAHCALDSILGATAGESRSCTLDNYPNEAVNSGARWRESE